MKHSSYRLTGKARADLREALVSVFKTGEVTLEAWGADLLHCLTKSFDVRRLVANARALIIMNLQPWVTLRIA
jgi:hypothetical protein